MPSRSDLQQSGHDPLDWNAVRSPLEIELYPIFERIERARLIVERAKLTLVSGTVGAVPGVKPSMTVQFSGDDWRILCEALGAVR